MKSFARNTFGTLQFQSFKKLLHKCWRKGPSLLSLLFWKCKIKTYVYFFSCKSEKHCSFWTQQTLPSELIFDHQASCTLPTFSTSSHTYTILSTGSLSVQGDYQSCIDVSIVLSLSGWDFPVFLQPNIERGFDDNDNFQHIPDHLCGD